ncbi:MAG TPA: FemAB family XrtA/PEP-CTERM system-associated protein [Rhizorhapis sp.]
MNAFVQSDTLTVALADLNDPARVAEIDIFVLRHEASTPFHRPAWLYAVAQGTGQRAHYLVARDLAGTVAGALPLIEIRSRLFGRIMVSSGFAVGGGILAHSRKAVSELAAAGWALAIEKGCPSLELRGGPVSGADWTEKTGTYVGFTRDLAKHDEAELLAIPRKQRAEVRKALTQKFDISIGSAEADRAAHFRVYSESVRNLGTPVFPRSLFDAVLDAFGSDADILTVCKEGRPVASVLNLYHRGAVLPYWGGGTQEARGLRANDMMYFALMSHARSRGCTRFDFGRSKVGTGAAAFKKNWGFEPEPLSYAVRTADGQPPRDINPLSPRYRLQVALWKKLPLTIANAVGPSIARGLG